jgi:hypothetical protein
VLRNWLRSQSEVETATAGAREIEGAVKGREKVESEEGGKKVDMVVR